MLPHPNIQDLPVTLHALPRRYLPGSDQPVLKGLLRERDGRRRDCKRHDGNGSKKRGFSHAYPSSRSQLKQGSATYYLSVKGLANFKNGRKLADDLKTDVSGPLLHLAQVGAIHIRLICKDLLRESLGVAEPAQIRGKNLTQIHAAKKAARRLLTHRF